MYMLKILQLEAYRAIGDKKYLDRDAVEMVAYLDQLYIPTDFVIPPAPACRGSLAEGPAVHFISRTL
jgi:hypothetical protein